MMSNFKLTLILTNICITCWYVNGGQAQGASILDKDFTFKALVECYDGAGKTRVGATSVTEIYSHQDRRGVVGLKVADDANRINYHYDSNHDVWIQVISSENLCISSSQYDLHLRLYESPIFSKMDDIYKAICADCSSDASQRHLFGTAKLLALVQRLRPRFGRPIEISTRAGDHQTVYNLANLKVDDSASVDLFVHYNKILDATSRPSYFEQPQFVRLLYRTKENVTHMIAVTFYHFELLSDMTSTQDQAEKVLHPLALPTGMFCSKVLRSSLGERRQAEVQMVQTEYSHTDSFSFSAKDLDSQSSLELTYFALDLRARLIRKDLSVSDLRSTTIYNLKDRIRFNIVTSRESTNEECVTNKIDDTIVDSNFKFIDLDRLVYMGKARINSVDALIYEEFSSKYSSSGLQFWIHAPVWATPRNAQKDPRFRVDELQGEHIYVTYYFALGSGGQQSTSDEIGPLLQVDITVRDSVSRIVWIRRMAISGFVAGHTEPTYSGMQIFSLANICQLDAKSGQVVALLESHHTNGSLHQIHPKLLERDERNEILVEALNREYLIQRSQIDHLSSQILTRDASEKVSFELDMTISQNLDQSLNPIECVYLGRGQLLGYDSSGAKNYTGITTFEDCMWLAHRHLIDLAGEEVMFTYTDRLECFVDRLFRYRSLQGHEATIAGSSSSVSLNYYPYEFGTKKIYTIEKRRVGVDTTSIPDKGMHFFRVGSLKMIGNNLELRLPPRDKLDLIFRRMNLSGYLAKVHGEKLHSIRVSGLSWSFEDAKNESNKLVVVSAPSRTPGAEMTQVECQSHCMFDLSCNSYSFCNHRGMGESQCLISSIDASKPIVVKQLEAIRDNLARPQRASSKKTTKRSATIMFDEGSLQQPEVEVVLDRSCSISGKSHADLFKRMYPVSVVTSAMINSIDTTIRDIDECAKGCLAKNIGYLKKVAQHRIANPDSIYINDDQSKLESIGDIVQEGLLDMCTSFLYADEMPKTKSDNQTVRGCLLVTPTSPEPTNYLPKITDYEEHVKMDPISMLQYKLVFSHLFQRVAGVRMLSESELNDLNGSEFEGRDGFMNNQIRLSIDDIEFCARACMRQTHGPKPMCSSYDFVHEHEPGRSIKYCLLNSLSLHNLKSTGSESDLPDQILHEAHDGVSFWHFEPRDAALQTANPHAKPHRSVQAADTCVAKSSSSAFMVISLMLSLIVGLLIGLKMTNYMIEISASETNGQTGRTARLIHRLSGVSLRSNLREVEVQMS